MTKKRKKLKHMFVQAARGKATGPKKEKLGAGVQWAPKMGKSPRVNFLDFAAYVAKTIFFYFAADAAKPKNVVNVGVILVVGPMML